MKLHEHQAKNLLGQHGIVAPHGIVAADAKGAVSAAEQLAKEGAGRFAVKAQVHAGGRGKGGGIKLADSPAAAGELAAAMLGVPLITPQTGADGAIVRQVLVESGVEIASELYVAVTLDRAARKLVVIASSQGGMEIEEVAAIHPEEIEREWLDPAWGLRTFQAGRVVRAIGVTGTPARGVASVIELLARAFVAIDATLVEINPLVITADHEVVALDAKVSLDDNALYRHADLAALRDRAEEQPLEAEAAESALSYVALDGNIGCMVNGAGLAMGTMDEIRNAGGDPANFLDVGGGASVERVATAFRILMQADNISAVLINIFGGIVRGDRVARGVVEALKIVDVTVPVVVRLQGTNAEEGTRILREADMEFIVADTLDEAARKAVSAAAVMESGQ